MAYCDYVKFKKDSLLLVSKIKKNSRFTKYRNIFPILRGGAVVAVSLSDRLGLEIVTNKTRIDPEITLVVDDILDSGITRMRWRRYDFATLHYRGYKPPTKRLFYFGALVKSWTNYWYEEYTC